MGGGCSSNVSGHGVVRYLRNSPPHGSSQGVIIGMTPAIRQLIDNGPPEGFLTRFLMLFGEKTTQTADEIEKAMTEMQF